MKSTTASALLALIAATEAHPGYIRPRDVDTRYPYKGPAVPIGDWVDQTVKGNGKGFPRLTEPPAVTPGSSKPTNNVNVISLSYMGPGGMNIHYQTPFGLGQAPSVKWGTSASSLTNTATGASDTYDRTPPCSSVDVVLCSQFFHNIQLTGLAPATTYYYQIPAANGTTQSQVMSFKTARLAGDQSAFTVAVLNDMGYTNALGTHSQLSAAADDEVAFAWHGGDISYADDWYSGVLPCELTGADAWPLCINGSDTILPNTPPAPFPEQYDVPLPAGEIPNQGGPQGGDMNVIYESNWDLWQNWMNNVTTKVPYMVLPGNHEAACAEFDGPGNILTAYLNSNETNSTAPTDDLTYWSCPVSQRNFTTFQHRFRMPGSESGGVGNFWYSFDYGMAHFVSLDAETDFAYSPEWPFIRDTGGLNNTPTEQETYSTDSGPFGQIDNNQYKNNSAFQQVQWLAADLAQVNRTKTPWVIAMSHRPMYSSEVSSYQANLRNAFQAILINAGVDLYLAGHIHWYERNWPLTVNGTIDSDSVIARNTYQTNPGKSLTHITNGMAGNIESHSFINSSKILNTTAVLNQQDYGFSKLTFHNASALSWQFVKGDGSGYGDELTILKKANSTSSSTASATASSKVSSTAKSTGVTTSTKVSSSAVATGSSSKASSTAVSSTHSSTAVATGTSSHASSTAATSTHSSIPAATGTSSKATSTAATSTHSSAASTATASYKASSSVATTSHSSTSTHSSTMTPSSTSSHSSTSTSSYGFVWAWPTARPTGYPGWNGGWW